MLSSDNRMNCDVSHASHKLSRYNLKRCDICHTYNQNERVLFLLTQFILFFGNKLYILHKKSKW